MEVCTYVQMHVIPHTHGVPFRLCSPRQGTPVAALASLAALLCFCWPALLHRARVGHREAAGRGPAHVKT